LRGRGNHRGTQDLADLDGRHADTARRRMDQEGVALLDVQCHRPGQRARRGRVGDGELDRLDEPKVLRLGEYIDLVRHRFLGEAAPVEHGHHLVADF